jgi:EAL domain-containing protein (putative c-di-GMP-specific phosphodiesterase class I)
MHNSWFKKHTALPQSRAPKSLSRNHPRFKPALDDVGSGLASLALLAHTKFDYVKVDRHVVLQVGTETPARAVFDALRAYASHTGCFLIAEGLEELALLDTVRIAGNVQGAQGYLLGLPGPGAVTGAVQQHVQALLTGSKQERLSMRQAS